MKHKIMTVKVIRENDIGVPKRSILTVREIIINFKVSYQILSDGEHLGELLNWLDVVEVEKESKTEHIN